MRIGIIGAGNIGGTLARRLTALGHEVSIANSRGPETLAALARETGAKPVTVQEAARAGDVVIVTIPREEYPHACRRDLFDGVPDDVVVVDTGNYYPQQRDGRIDADREGHHREPVGFRAAGPAGGQGVQQHLRPPACWSAASPRAPPGASPCRSRATTGEPRTSSSGCSTSSGSTGWTPGAWTSRGGSSPARRSTAPTSTPRACAARWARRRRSARRGSAPPPPPGADERVASGAGPRAGTGSTPIPAPGVIDRMT